MLQKIVSMEILQMEMVVVVHVQLKQAGSVQDLFLNIVLQHVVMESELELNDVIMLLSMQDVMLVVCL